MASGCSLPSPDWQLTSPFIQEYLTIQYDDFTAELVVGGDISLYGFAAFIIKAVCFDFDHCFEFCDNLRNPYRSKERYTLFADIGEGEPGDHSVKKTPLYTVFRSRRRICFHGTPPEQYPDFDT